MKINGNGKLDEKEIIKFEEEIGFKLPKDYKKFLCEYNGGYPDPNYPLFTIYEMSVEEIEEMGEATGLDYLCSMEKLISWKKECNGELPEKVIVIGMGLFGLILLSENENMKGIYLWDTHWCITDIGDKDAAIDEELSFSIYKISNTFSEFLEKLYYNEDDIVL